MKFIQKIMVVACLVMVAILASCDDQLELDPVGSLTELNEPEEYRLGLIGAYDVLNDNNMYGFNMGILAGLGTDTYTTYSNNQGFELIDRYQILSNNPIVSATYNNTYRGIARANFVASEILKAPEYIPPSDDLFELSDTTVFINGDSILVGEDDRLTVAVIGTDTLTSLLASAFEIQTVNEYLGEAYALRALFHFNLVRLFNNVPLVIEPITDYNTIFTRDPLEDIYAQIVSDLKFAKEVLPPIPAQDGRMSQGAAQGLLAKVYLTMAGYPLQADRVYYDSAYMEAKEFIDLSSGGVYPFGLSPSYAAIFSELNENNEEIIFDAQAVAGSEDGMRWGRWGGFGAGSRNVQQFEDAGQNPPRVLIGFYKSYAEEDLIRRIRNATDTFYNNAGLNVRGETAFQTYTIAKFRVEPNTFSINGQYTPEQSPVNFPILRYADMLLIAAEAANEMNGAPTPEAYNYLNQVRERVKLTPYDGSNFLAIYPNWQATPGTNNTATAYGAFKEAIFWERAWELCYEAHRKFDLVRWNRFRATVANLFGYPDGGEADQEASENRNNISDVIFSHQNVRDFHQYYPIPLQEMNIQNNNFQQNPGY